MNKFLLGALLFGTLLTSSAQSNYKVQIDLTATADDKVPVTVFTPPSDSAFLEYHMAKIVPGTYSISDFGRFVSDFQAFDSAGNSLQVDSISVNKWKISNGGKLRKITYKID
ncbi:MAG: peptidase M61, partial [Marinoscillum sp.]